MKKIVVRCIMWREYIYTISTNSLWVDKSQTFVTLCLMKWWVCLCSW